MFRQTRPLGYLLPFAVVALVLIPLQTSAQLRGANDRETFVNSPPTLALTSDTSVVSACADTSPRVQLNAQATSPSGNPIRYRWKTSAGSIVGEGPVVTWDLAGLSPGYYKAFIEIDSGDGETACQAFSSRSILVNPCPPPRPVCPNVSVTCPTAVVAGQPITFSSNVAGGIPAGTYVYNWTVSVGTIIEGQGTPTIKVDTTGLVGEQVRATLTMGGLPLNCSDSCAVQVPIPPAKCRKFDEFPDIPRNDEKARLDNYGIELQNDPTSTGYVTIFPGRTSKSGDVQRHTARIIDYLVNSRGIDARRIVTRVGPVRDELMVELWACPQGVTPPQP